MYKNRTTTLACSITCPFRGREVERSRSLRGRCIFLSTWNDDPPPYSVISHNLLVCSFCMHRITQQATSATSSGHHSPATSFARSFSSKCISSFLFFSSVFGIQSAATAAPKNILSLRSHFRRRSHHSSAAQSESPSSSPLSVVSIIGEEVSHCKSNQNTVEYRYCLG